MAGVRIRCHGDYHLGRVLYTGNDFHIIDFRGELSRAPSERRIKRSPLRDVASMVRSFHYAVLMSLDANPGDSPEARSRRETWARSWYQWVASRFLRAYLKSPASRGLIPASREDVRALLEAQLLEKAVYEIGFELEGGGARVSVPLRGLLDLFDTKP